MKFEIGDEVECIKGAHWKGIKDYCAPGDRAILKSRDWKGNTEVFEMEMTRGQRRGEILPITVDNIDVYFKKVEQKKSEYRVGVRLVAHEKFELSYLQCDRGDVAVILTQVDDLFDIKHEKSGKKFQFYSQDIRRYFDVESPNPCPPSLRKWLSDVQTKTTQA